MKSADWPPKSIVFEARQPEQRLSGALASL
jgi:hypothetical protein